MKRLLTVLGVCIVSACGEANSSSKELGDSPSGYFMPCAADEVGRYFDVSPSMRRRLGAEKICVSNASHVVVGSQVRFVPSRNGSNQLILQCGHDAESFFKSRAGKDVLLIIGGSVVEELLVPSDSIKQRCAIQLGSDMLGAFQFCEEVAAGMGHSAEGCLKPCVGSEAVCIPTE